MTESRQERRARERKEKKSKKKTNGGSTENTLKTPKKGFGITIISLFLLLVSVIVYVSFDQDKTFSQEIGERIDAYPPDGYGNVIHQVMALGLTPRLEKEIVKIINVPTKEVPFAHFKLIDNGEPTEDHVGILPLVLCEKVGFDYQFNLQDNKKCTVLDLVEGHFLIADQVVVANAGIDGIQNSFAVAHSMWVETGRMTLHEMLTTVMKPEIRKLEMAWFIELMARYLHYKKKPFDTKIAIGAIKKKMSINELVHGQFKHTSTHIRYLVQNRFSPCTPTEDAAHLYDALITVHSLFQNDKEYKEASKKLYTDQMGLCITFACKFSQNYEDLEGMTADWQRLGIGCHFLEYDIPIFVKKALVSNAKTLVDNQMNQWKKESLDYAKRLLKQEKKWSREEHHFMVHVKLWLDAASLRGEEWVKNIKK